MKKQDNASKIRIKHVYVFFFILLFIGCNVKTKTRHVGILSGNDVFLGIAEGFKSRMSELGYRENSDIVYDLKKSDSDPATEQSIIKKFIDSKADLIFVYPTEQALTAKKFTRGTNIPVVFAMAGIEGNNLIKTISSPGENITGVRFSGPDITVKRFEILLEFMPELKRLYIVYQPAYPNAGPTLAVLRPAVASKGVTLIEDRVNSIKELRAVLSRRNGQKNMDAILIMPEILTQSEPGWTIICKFAEKNRIPVAGGGSFSVRSGAIFSYAFDLRDTGALAAELADKIFNGTPAGSIFVVTPDSRLYINYTLAKKLGLTVNERLMSRANEIIR